MKERILETLAALRAYALSKGYEVSLFYHEEDSYLMRFANSAISLNTNEHLIRLEIEAYSGRQRASYELITNLDKIEEMKQAIDTAAEMVPHAQPLTYQPTMAEFSSSFEDESGYDPALARMSNQDKLDYFNLAAAGLEDGDLKLSGIFSCGENIIAQSTTRSEHTQFFRTSDAEITTVLSHARLKWEVIAEQSAQAKVDLDPAALHVDLTFLAERYRSETPQQIPLGEYDIVFGRSAIADLIYFLKYIGFDGGLMKRGFSFLSEEKIGQQVFSEKFTLSDDPTRRETFPFQRDFIGMLRTPFPIVQQGVFQGFVWSQDDADEFGAQPSGHTVSHLSLALQGGDHQARSLKDLVEMPRQQDLLFIPNLHYMNIVNPSQGMITGSSRFGALLLKADGSLVVPYNVRLTQSLADIFGSKVAWLSQTTRACNISSSYGARNPAAIIVPSFMQVNGLEISHSNASY